jgi:large subunit ribosomal protein L13
MNQKTTLPKVKNIVPKWYLIDATDQILGRLSTRVADLLRGKNSVDYTPFYDQGNFVCVINASKIRVTGKKLDDKMYYRYTGYIGNLKEINLKDKLEKDATKVIELSVRRMLPKNKLAKSQMDRLKVYNDSDHPHKGQTPTLIDIK